MGGIYCTYVGVIWLSFVKQNLLVYREKKSKEARNYKYDRSQSGKVKTGAVFFERMPYGMFLLKWDAVAFFQKKLHPKGFGEMEDCPN